MATKFGRIDAAESSFEEQTFNKGQTLTSASTGVHYQLGIRDCKSEDPDGLCDNQDTGAVLNNIGIHWAAVHNLFYMSGSQKVLDTMPADAEKFNSYYHNFNQYNDLKPFHTNKFYESASIFYIPQAYIGNRIQPGSFELSARTESQANSGSENKEIIIKDDGNGNLYSPNATYSQSANSLSSSQNYLGNVIYDLGIAVLTETGSWSGSHTGDGVEDINYMDIGRVDKHDRWTINLNGSTPIFTSQWTIKIPSGEFNMSMNSTQRPYGQAEHLPTADLGPSASIQDVANTRTELTTGSFSPYFTQIHLYRNQTEEPVLIASLPRAIQMRSDVDIVITFRLDH